MTGTYRQVYPSFWQDNFILGLTPEEKYFYLYLITNSKSSFCGIYELPLKVAEFETGYNSETIQKLIKKFEGYKKIKYSFETNEICIINFAKYNVNRSPKVQAAYNKSLANVKDKKLIPYIYPMDRVSSETETETVSEAEEYIPYEDKPHTSAPKQNENDTKKTTKSAEIKHKYGEYQHVMLTETELSKLKADYKNADELIKFLDEYIEMKGYKAKSHYMAIRKWVADAVEEQACKNQRKSKNAPYHDPHPSYDLNEFSKLAMNNIPDFSKKT